MSYFDESLLETRTIDQMDVDMFSTGDKHDELSLFAHLLDACIWHLGCNGHLNLRAQLSRRT